MRRECPGTKSVSFSCRTGSLSRHAARNAVRFLGCARNDTVSSALARKSGHTQRRKDWGFLLTEGFVQAYNLRLAASVCLDLAARRTSSLALTMEHKASDRVCLWIISSLIRRLFSFVGLAVGHACVWQGRLILVRGGFATHVDSAKDYGHGASAVTTSLLKLKDLGR
jgi:hypothetical protein